MGGGGVNSLKDHSKLIVGSFYRPPDKGIEPILNLETELSEITEKLRNNSKYTVMLGGDFNATNIVDWLALHLKFGSVYF